MKFSTLSSTLSVLAAVASVQAHTTVFGVWINGVWQGDGRGKYIRSPPNNNPVKDLNGSSMYCNVNNNAVPTTLSVKSGDKVTFEWYHDNRNDDIIASSHKGPVVVYIAPTGGSSWTKIYQEGYSGTWAVDKLIAAKGQHSITIPNIAAGNYLLRAELITLHEADTAYNANSARGVQLYPSCTQIRVTSSGSASLPGGASFPGTYKYTDPGIVFNLYSAAASSYKIPGPAVWSGASGGSIGQVGNPATATAGPTGTSGPGGPSTTTTAGGAQQTAYGQCGGQGWTGPTSCVSGYKCQSSGEYYSQCVPA